MALRQNVEVKGSLKPVLLRITNGFITGDGPNDVRRSCGEGSAATSAQALAATSAVARAATSAVAWSASGVQTSSAKTVLRSPALPNRRQS